MVLDVCRVGLRATFELSCVDMHEGFVFFSAEQLDMLDGIVCVAITTTKRKREHDHGGKPTR